MEKDANRVGLLVRLSDKERKVIAEGAMARGEPVAVFIRSSAIRAARAAVRKAGKDG